MSKVVIMNAARMDFDGKLDFSVVNDDIEVYASSTTEELIARAEGAAVIVTKEIPVSASTIEALPDSVKMICEAGTGYNNIDLPAARAKGITVCNIPAYSTDRVAHTAVMLMLMLSSTMQTQMKMLGRGDRSNFTEHLKVDHVELNGKTLGIIGEGAIGKAVIKIALAMGMKIIVYSRTQRPDTDDVKHVSFEELLKQADYVSLHCALNDATKHIIDAEAIDLMKPTAFLINTSRGGLIDEPALIEALKAGRIAGAGLDVQETEPPVAGNALYELDNVVMTPHMGWKGKETRDRLVGIIAQDVQAFLAGSPVNVVS